MKVPNAPVIGLDQLNRVIVDSLPELRDDLAQYRLQKAGDPDLGQTFFSYSFIPTLQAALDRNVEEFAERAFSLVEALLTHGDPEVRALLDDEFFAYGPHCDGWMEKAAPHMGPRTLTIAQQIASRR